MTALVVCRSNGWLRRPDCIFRAALFLSVLAHLLVLGWLKFPEYRQLPATGEGYATLTVQLSSRPTSAIPDQQPVIFTNDLRLELVTPSPALLPEPPVVEMIEKNQEVVTEKSSVEVIEQSEPVVPEHPTPPPAFVDHRDPATRPGMATVFLRISEDGRVLQMIWDKLPVVTREELLQMERELREKLYPATGSAYSVAETVIVPRARGIDKVAP